MLGEDCLGVLDGVELGAGFGGDCPAVGLVDRLTGARGIAASAGGSILTTTEAEVDEDVDGRGRDALGSRDFAVFALLATWFTDWRWEAT